MDVSGNRDGQSAAAPVTGSEPDVEGERASASGRMRVVLVDNNPTTLLGVRVLLRDTESAEVVGESREADEAARLVEYLAPDLVVLDPDLRASTGGLELCRRIKALPEPPRVLIYTTQNSREDVAAACIAGADAYLYKGVECERLLEALSRAYGGDRVWFLGREEEESSPGIEAMIEESGLTPKEGEILARLVDHRTNTEIAAELCLSHNTVKSHVHNVLKKLGLKNRKELFRDISS